MYFGIMVKKMASLIQYIKTKSCFLHQEKITVGNLADAWLII